MLLASHLHKHDHKFAYLLHLLQGSNLAEYQTKEWQGLVMYFSNI